ncbi:hypothetical protein C8R47DRAFT_1285718 [Mycena vitilis]|nr:hypothetical protein C8R47DRAFT_1285718 [Mycena vitilis]
MQRGLETRRHTTSTRARASLCRAAPAPNAHTSRSPPLGSQKSTLPPVRGTTLCYAQRTPSRWPAQHVHRPPAAPRPKTSRKQTPLLLVHLRALLELCAAPSEPMLNLDNPANLPHIRTAASFGASPCAPPVQAPRTNEAENGGPALYSSASHPRRDEATAPVAARLVPPAAPWPLISIHCASSRPPASPSRRLHVAQSARSMRVALTPPLGTAPHTIRREICIGAQTAVIRTRSRCLPPAYVELHPRQTHPPASDTWSPPARTNNRRIRARAEHLDSAPHPPPMGTLNAFQHPRIRIRISPHPLVRSSTPSQLPTTSPRQASLHTALLPHTRVEGRRLRKGTGKGMYTRSCATAAHTDKD